MKSKPKKSGSKRSGSKKSGSKRSGPKRPGSKKSRSINFEPILVLSVIALLLIGFIYWSEHAAVPVKTAVVPVKTEALPVKHAAVPVKPEAVPVKQEAVPVKTTAVPVKPEAVPVKQEAVPVKAAGIAPVKPARIQIRVSSIPVKPAVTPKIAVPPAAVEKAEIRGASKKVAAPPSPAERQKKPRVAIVIDDFGYSVKNLDTFLNINEPLTLAILPNQRYSREVANKARSRGYEVILHLPLESWRNDVKEEAVTIRSGMSERDIGARLKKEFADVPGATGASNHMGSKSTEDSKVMTDVLLYLKKNDMCFFDSFTTPRSVCRDVASETGVRFAKRDRFLDNANDIPSIEKQLRDLKDVAVSRGRAIAVCHDRPNTASALANVMPEMAREGIEFVYLSDMVD